MLNFVTIFHDINTSPGTNAFVRARGVIGISIPWFSSSSGISITVVPEWCTLVETKECPSNRLSKKELVESTEVSLDSRPSKSPSSSSLIEEEITEIWVPNGIRELFLFCCNVICIRFSTSIYLDGKLTLIGDLSPTLEAKDHSLSIHFSPLIYWFVPFIQPNSRSQFWENLE